jgi:hypothetical protein
MTTQDGSPSRLPPPHRALVPDGSSPLGQTCPRRRAGGTRKAPPRSVSAFPTAAGGETDTTTTLTLGTAPARERRLRLARRAPQLSPILQSPQDARAATLPSRSSPSRSSPGSSGDPRRNAAARPRGPEVALMPTRILSRSSDVLGKRMTSSTWPGVALASPVARASNP